MLDPRLLYDFNPTLWETLRGTRPVLIHLLDGFLDAGQVGRTLTDSLFASCRSELLVEFDVDQLHDYRSRRPTMVFDTDRWTSVEGFELAIHKMTTEQGKVFLLLSGPEPDTQWLRMLDAVTGLAQRLDVRLAITAHGIPMAVPHTRPSLVTTHATNRELLTEENPVWMGRVEVPGSFAGMLELRLGELGIDAMGLAINVPHYLAQSPFHQAGLEALERINNLTGLELPVTGLREQSATNLREITTEMENSTEVSEVVSQLEAAYDEHRHRQERAVPSADEIGAELEKFLAEQDRKDED